MGSVCRVAARLGSVSDVLIRLLGVGGSTSRISRSISSSAAFLNVSRSIGVLPVKQLVKDHAQGINVGTRVDVDRIERRLLGGHVQRRAGHRAEGAVQALLGQLQAAGRLGEAEVDHLGHRVCRRGFPPGYSTASSRGG